MLTVTSLRTTGALLLSVVIFSATALLHSAAAGESKDEALASEFAYLSKNGNSNCSQEFRDSIATCHRWPCSRAPAAVPWMSTATSSR